MGNDLLEKVLNSPNLPTMPGVALQVLQLARDPDTDSRRVAKAISSDPALAVKVLKTVNSGFYALRTRVSSLSRAVVVLGMQGAKALALGFSLAKQFNAADTAGFDLDTFWRRSVYSAVAAKAICTRIRSSREEEAFLAALLQDIGTLGIHWAIGDEYDQVHARASDHEHLPQAEADQWGLHHGAVGAEMGNTGRCPRPLPERSHFTMIRPELPRTSNPSSRSSVCPGPFRKSSFILKSPRRSFACATWPRNTLAWPAITSSSCSGR